MQDLAQTAQRGRRHPVPQHSAPCASRELLQQPPAHCARTALRAVARKSCMCFPFSSNTTRLIVGFRVINATGCTPCAAGTSSQAGGPCLPCPGGQYSNSSTGFTCINCPAGWRSYVPICVQAHACLLFSNSDCSIQTFGRSTANTGSASCVQCTVPGTSSTTGSFDCWVNCPRGTYSNTLTGFLCVGCSTGTFSYVFRYGLATEPSHTLDVLFDFRRVRSGGCTDCPDGTQALALNSSICAPCPAGQYSNDTTGGLCTACPVGTYS